MFATLFSSNKHQLRLIHICTALLLFLTSVTSTAAFSIRDLVRGDKRADKNVDCPPWAPFSCPSGDCVPFKYICDGSADCSDQYDENEKLCAAAARPPVEETSSFFTALLNAHGPNFFVPIFGHRAAGELAAMGGIDAVSVSISQSPTIEAFGTEMKMNASEVDQMRKLLESLVVGLPAKGLSENEAADFRFFAQKLKETNFF